MALINLHRKYSLNVYAEPPLRREAALPTEHRGPNASPGAVCPCPASPGGAGGVSRFVQQHRRSSGAAASFRTPRGRRPLPTAVSRSPQAPNRRKLHPKLLEAARLQAASTQHMSQSKQIARNFSDMLRGHRCRNRSSRDVELPAGRGTCVGKGLRSPQRPDLQLCRRLSQGTC